MSEERSDTSRSLEQPDRDDLKLINGIGIAVEDRLHDHGIYTFAQLVALSPADIAAAIAGLAGLSAERIIKQGWIGQARKLASKSVSSEAQEGIEALAEVEAPPVVVELELAAPAAEITEPVPPIVAPPGPEEDQIPQPVVAITEPIGVPRLSQIETVPAGTHTPQNCLPYGQPLDVRLTLDLSDVRVPNDTQFSYRASIYSKSLEGHSRQAVGETSGIFTPTDKVTVGIEGIVLPKDTYRLKAMVILNPMTTEPTPQSSLVASKESDLLLIF